MFMKDWTETFVNIGSLYKYGLVKKRFIWTIEKFHWFGYIAEQTYNNVRLIIMSFEGKILLDFLVYGYEVLKLAGIIDT